MKRTPSDPRRRRWSSPIGAKKMARPAQRADFVAEGDSFRGGVLWPLLSLVLPPGGDVNRDRSRCCRHDVRGHVAARRPTASTSAAGGPQLYSPSKSWANRPTRSDESFNPRGAPLAGTLGGFEAFGLLKDSKPSGLDEGQ